MYLSTILGAWLADRLIGPERTLFYSAVVVMAGHIALAVLPGLAGVGVGLVLVALGSGGVKANATSLVGSLYDEQDERRDAGFSVFYMGIMVALFFLSVALGTAMSGLLSGYYHPKNEVPYFLWLGVAAIAVGAVLLVIVKPVRRLMHGVHRR